ncbi:sodium- and chloride-dependent GABA transporter 1-like [Acipenser oxyrinchus oxyrinchus]|uniref:Sodium- and chloride-dependent GABA transporter 1-like n=1 Tax=Acipenser oxyrinchus oxyrinchus TaxID=40147 RepID=A0AAD8FP91_ACIOX|nr:sodium- and chloride-dependent GABA transporter 1-like [Acipenser oxyrinchus oxyrinchus]
MPWPKSAPIERCGSGYSGDLISALYLLQCYHRLGPLLPLQLLSVDTALAELQQHLEHSENCSSGFTGNATHLQSASQQFFDRRVLQMSSGVDQPGQIRWELLGLLILAWIIVYLCIFKGIKSTGKLPGAKDGILYFLTRDGTSYSSSGNSPIHYYHHQHHTSAHNCYYYDL